MKVSLNVGTFYEVHDIHAADSAEKPAQLPVILVAGTVRDPGSKKLTAVSLIRCDKNSAPWCAPFEWFEERVARGEYIQIGDAANPAAPGIRCVEDLEDEERQEAFKKKVAENSALIAPVLALGWNAFDPHARNKVLRQVAAGSVDGKRHSIRWLNSLLWRYWTGGALALGPQYYRCGAHSRAAIAELINSGKEPKVGRRSGRTPKVITTAMQARNPDRGGAYIDPFAEGFISTLIRDYIKDPLRKKEIELSLDRRRSTMPWTAITNYVNGKLKERPDYKHIEASVSQIRYIGAKNVHVLEVMNKIMGKRYTDLNHRPHHGDYRDVAFYAGHRYEIDTVRGDIHLVDDITRMPIGRPNIILVVDTYSGLIVGVYITVEEVTFAHISRALHCAFSPKSEWCLATVGLTIGKHEWDFDGRCGHLTADNAQFLADAAQAIPELVADTGICRAYRPDDKGLVESTAELANLGVIHLFRYGVTKGPKERAKEDSARDASVSIQTFAREFIRWVIDVANHRSLPVDRELDPSFVATGLDPTPFNVANWSRSEHGGPPNPYNKNTWMPRLLERFNATVTEHGLEVDGVYFDAPGDKAFALMKARASVGKVTKKPVHVDRLTTRQIYLVPDDIKEPPQVIPLSHYSRNCSGLSFREAELRADHRNAKAKDAKSALIPRKHKQTQEQAAATQADQDAVIDEHGSIGARNHTAKGTDLEQVKRDQAARDHAKDTAEMHGADTSSDANTDLSLLPTDNANKPNARPKSFD